MMRHTFEYFAMCGWPSSAAIWRGALPAVPAWNVRTTFCQRQWMVMWPFSAAKCKSNHVSSPNCSTLHVVSFYLACKHLGQALFRISRNVFLNHFKRDDTKPGLWTLDYGLDYGLDFGLDSKLILCCRAVYLIAFNLVSRVRNNYTDSYASFWHRCQRLRPRQCVGREINFIWARDWV